MNYIKPTIQLFATVSRRRDLDFPIYSLFIMPYSRLQVSGSDVNMHSESEPHQSDSDNDSDDSLLDDDLADDEELPPTYYLGLAASMSPSSDKNATVPIPG